MPRYVLEDLQMFAANKGGKLRSVVYSGPLLPLEWECSLGHSWTTCWSSVHNQHSWCPVCEKASRGNDLTGRVFSRLTVLGKSDASTPRRLKWLCRCVCGNEISVRTDGLTSGHTNSCGCYNKDRLFEANAKNLAGLTFGRLTVISLNPKYKKGKVSWICKCSCGNTSIVITQSLVDGKTNSCGCLIRETASKTTTLRNRLYRKLHGLNEPTMVRRIRCLHKKFRVKVIARDNNCCVLCSSKKSLEVHHIVPLCKEIINSPNNLVTLCRTCHTTKAHIPTNTSLVNKKVQHLLKEYINNIASS